MAQDSYPQPRSSLKKCFQSSSKETWGKTAVLKPVVQAIFEWFYDQGFRSFCFIVGRGKRAIEDHFTPDWSFVEILRSKGKKSYAGEIEAFYEKILDSDIVWVNQPEPKGFGDAVLHAETFIGSEDFIVHAGDTYLPDGSLIRRMVEIYGRLKAKSVFLVQRVKDPENYGVISGRTIGKNLIRVEKLVEKPAEPVSNLAVIPVYIFNHIIFDAIRDTKPDRLGEIQLTDAIQKMVDQGYDVYAMALDSKALRLDVGTVETYWKALNISRKMLT